MNYVIFNGDLVDLGHISFEAVERAFYYGDGIFETIACINHNIKFLDKHLERLYLGLQVLKLEPHQTIDAQSITQWVNILMNKSNLTSCRIKLQVWRNSGGLYTPHTPKASFMVQCIPWQFPYITRDNFLEQAKPLHVGFCESIKLSYSKISSIKTCNSLPYVLASIEKTERNVDDLILFDRLGNMSELTSSNLFWVKGRQSVYTPALHTGCIAGVMRSLVIDLLQKNGFLVKEVTRDELILNSSHMAFATNVTGIKIITHINGEEVYGKPKVDSFLDSELFSLLLTLLN